MNELSMAAGCVSAPGDQPEISNVDYNRNYSVASQDRLKSWYSRALALFEKQASDAYRKISFHGKEASTGFNAIMSGNLKSQAQGFEGYLNKPLPPLPRLPQQPYFEYIFADANLCSRNSKDATDSSSLSSQPAPDILCPEADQKFSSQHADRISAGGDSNDALDPTDISQFACAQAGLDVTTREVTHDFRNTPDADIQTDIHLSDGKALECGNVISESTAGTLKPRSFSHVSLADHCQTPNGLDTFTEAVDKYQSKQILVPKSQKTKAALNETHFLVDSCYSPSITSPVRPPPPLTIRKVTKRNARDSFLTKSTVDGSRREDFEINLLSTKKLRITETQVDHDVRSMYAVSMCGSVSDIAPEDCSDEIESCDDLLLRQRRRLTSALTGYPGQFESYESEYLSTRATRIHKPLETHTTGDPIHPNSEFTHVNFVADPTWPAKNYTRADLDRLPVRNLALQHAESESLTAASLLTRTPSEEDLRREVHLECAAARLEGVAVGQYRYYQGHLSLEEYKAARMCVCWEMCFCSKLCTIYGDVLCPCAEWIVLHKD